MSKLFGHCLLSLTAAALSPNIFLLKFVIRIIHREVMTTMKQHEKVSFEPYMWPWKIEVMVGVKTGMIWPNINLFAKCSSFGKLGPSVLYFFTNATWMPCALKYSSVGSLGSKDLSEYLTTNIKN